MSNTHREQCETVTDRTVTSNAGAPDPAEVLAYEAERFRGVLADSRSTIIVRLFDYLLSRCGDERAPKEIEIAIAVFGKDASFDTAQDSIARVHAHRLRRRMEDFYADSTGPRLVMPNGEYRIILAEGSAAKPSPVISSRWSVRRHVAEARWWLILTLFAVVTALPWAATLFRQQHPPRPDVVDSVLWASVAASRQQPLVVAGDHYLFAESENEKDVQRLIMQPGIRSRRDLGSYSIRHPEDFLRYYDQDVHNVPAAAAAAVWSFLSLASGLWPDAAAKPDLIVSSRLSEQQLRTRDVIYVGRLSALGVLSNPLLYASGFRLGNSPDELIDTVSGKRYVAGAGVPGASPEGQYSTDYGYIASFLNPFGRRVIIIAGLGDAGVSRMMDIVTDKQKLDQLSDSNGKASSFEALYEVRAIGTMAVGSSLLISRAMKTGKDRDNR
jgi:hypothetical protein